MDPTPTPPVPEALNVQRALSSHGILLGQHDQHLRALADGNQVIISQLSDLTRQLATLSAQMPPPPPAASAAVPTAPSGSVPVVVSHNSHATDPPPFDGQLELCRGFLLQCEVVFLQKPASFSCDQAKVQYMLGLLRGRALKWAEAVFSNRAIGSFSYAEFSMKLRTVFDHPSHQGAAADQLLNLQQGSRSVADYSVDFWTYAADSGWNEEALKAVFVKGLRDPLKKELFTAKQTANLDSLVSLAIQLDNRDRFGQDCEARSASGLPPRSRPPGPGRVQASPTSASPPRDARDEPMQLGRARLSPEERSRRLRSGIYLQGRTEDGLGMMFGVNHIGHFLLTNLLLDRLKESERSRVVNVSSVGHNFGTIDFDCLNTHKALGLGTSHRDVFQIYCHSKLCNVLFTHELAKRLQGTNVTCYSLHPGAIKTELARNIDPVLQKVINLVMAFFTKNAVQGAQTTLHCALQEGIEPLSGRYFSNCTVREVYAKAKDDAAAKKLWELSERLCGLA